MTRKHRSFRVHAAFVLASLILPAAASAATVTGTVTDKTTNHPAAGDDVVLIALGQGMQEAGRTKTDAHGHFSIDVPDNNMHLLRVDHEKAAYFQPLPPGTTHADVDVYDVAAKVKGVSTEADVLRLETDPQGLHVIENYFVKNESTPPKTQFSPQAYPIALPTDAQIEASAAMGPGGMPVASSPVPTGQKGHFAFVFPIRPGETRFQVSYHVRYSGSMTFTPVVTTPTDNLAVMMPESMKFTPANASQFQPVKDNVQAQTFVAKNLTPSEAVSFTVSGTGSMPRDSQDQQAQQGPQDQGAPSNPEQGSAAAAADTRPGGGLGNPIDTPDPLNKYKWWILSGIALVLAVAAAFLLRGRPATAGEVARAPEPSPLTPTVVTPAGEPVVPVNAPNGSVHSPAVLNALKEELFALETERMEGKLTDQQYAETRAAFEVVLRRALARRS